VRGCRTLEQQSRSFPFTKLVTGVCALLFLSGALGLAVNKMRSHGLPLPPPPFSCKTLLLKQHLKRNEILYVGSQYFKRKDLSDYVFCGVTPSPVGSHKSIRGSIDYGSLVVEADTNVVFYGAGKDRGRIKKLAMKALPRTRRPVCILADGLDGWIEKGLPVESDH
jgi:hypothetical protein